MITREVYGSPVGFYYDTPIITGYVFVGNGFGGGGGGYYSPIYGPAPAVAVVFNVPDLGYPITGATFSVAGNLITAAGQVSPSDQGTGVWEIYETLSAGGIFQSISTSPSDPTTYPSGPLPAAYAERPFMQEFAPGVVQPGALTLSYSAALLFHYGADGNNAFANPESVHLTIQPTMLKAVVVYDDGGIGLGHGPPPPTNDGHNNLVVDQFDGVVAAAWFGPVNGKQKTVYVSVNRGALGNPGSGKGSSAGWTTRPFGPLADADSDLGLAFLPNGRLLLSFKNQNTVRWWVNQRMGDPAYWILQAGAGFGQTLLGGRAADQTFRLTIG